jgi:hypothetical protein
LSARTGYLHQSPKNGFGDRVDVTFGVVAVQRITEFHVNPVIAKPRDRCVNLAVVEISEDCLDIDATAILCAHPNSSLLATNS